MSQHGRVRYVTGFCALAVGGALGVWGTHAILRAEGNQDAPAAAVAAPSGLPTPGVVTALGRLEPKDGIIRVAGPSRFAVVIAQLLVDDGETVKEGEPIAILD